MAEVRTPNPDRTVHATLVPDRDTSIEVVRYGRSGKWWIEHRMGAQQGERSNVTIKEAVDLTFDTGMSEGGGWRKAWVYWGRPGGSSFTRALMKHVRAADAQRLFIPNWTTTCPTCGNDEWDGERLDG